MRTSFPTASEDDQFGGSLQKIHESPTGNSSDIIRAVCLQHTLDGGPLSVVGGVVTVRADVYTKGDLHINLGLVDGLQYEMRKVTVRTVKPNTLRSHEKCQDKNKHQEAKQVGFLLSHMTQK